MVLTLAVDSMANIHRLPKTIINTFKILWALLIQRKRMAGFAISPLKSFGMVVIFVGGVFLHGTLRLIEIRLFLTQAIRSTARLVSIL